MLGVCNLCARVLHEVLIFRVLLYDNETMVWGKKERSRIRAVQMNNLTGLGYEENGQSDESTKKRAV